ncbi:MAG TPA: hypothetical protein VHY21_15480 [Pseudonocardiaceae bacterium]|jgi:hypothetical protein|nr:hypothetical protein [Pseudonocardiaceae bacterium]
MVLGVVLAAVLAAGTTVLVARNHRGAPEAGSAVDWTHSEAAAAKPAQAGELELVQLSSNWQNQSAQQQTESAGQVREALADVQISLREAGSGLGRLSPRPGAPQALPSILAAVRLYGESAGLLGSATLIADVPLRQQVLLESIRVRFLGDRLYAAARALPAPGGPADPLIHFEPGPPIPDWASMAAGDKCLQEGSCASLEPGPPLDDKVALTAPTIGATGPAEPTSRWVSAVGDLHILGAASETTAITGSSAPVAQLVARTLGEDRERVAALTPPGDAAVGYRLQIALLVDAEAARSAQSAALGGDQARASLIVMARALAATGDSLWDTELLGPRSTGLSQVVVNLPDLPWYPR